MARSAEDSLLARGAQRGRSPTPPCFLAKSAESLEKS